MAETQASEPFTRLLERLRQGDEGARAPLLNSIYGELRRLAAHYMSNERTDHTLQPTALVHEAWMRFSASGNSAESKAHFMALAAGAMKQVLIDHARKNRSAKRGGEKKERVTLNSSMSFAGSSANNEVLEICDSLEKLRQLDSRQAQLVELRVFGGLSLEESADALGISLATVKRDWLLARAWLYRELA